jgi:hypothetical protein
LVATTARLILVWNTTIIVLIGIRRRMEQCVKVTVRGTRSRTHFNLDSRIEDRPSLLELTDLSV